jgi:predicted metal-binding membrane protein
MVLRAQLGLVATLLAVSAAGWWWTVAEMRGMDGGPWTALGAFGWFVGVWVAMTAAMMLPAIAPVIALFRRMAGPGSVLAPSLFVAGYLLLWGAVGVAAFVVFRLAGGALAWDRSGRWVAGAVLLFAALYELTPVKDVCLGKCRSPFGFLVGAWRDGRAGAVRMGARHGVWCVGCCWALMASLFALGVMNIAWTAFVAGLIALEKLAPYRRVATWATALVFLVLGVLVLVDPDAIPGLTLPIGAT